MNSNYELLKISPYEDHRGILKKTAQKSMLKPGEEIQEVYVLYSNKGTTRGNHYHIQTKELFTVISGEARIALSDINKQNIEILTIRAADNTTLKVYPYTVHAIKNESDAPLIVLAVSLKEYYPHDTDTFTCNILD